MDVDADGHPEQTHIVIVPLPGIERPAGDQRSPQPKHWTPAALIELRMDDVRGRFVFDNGLVTMNDVSFQFRGAPVRFDARDGRRRGHRPVRPGRQRPLGQGDPARLTTCARRCRP